MRHLLLFGALTLFLSLTGCKAVVGLVTKNWKKPLLEQHTSDYNLHVVANLSGGCPQSTWGFSPDSIIITNGQLTAIIGALTDRPSSRIVYDSMTWQSSLKLDIRFVPTHAMTLEAGKDSLLRHLAQRLGFTVNNVEQSKEILLPYVVDATKLANHLVTPSRGLIHTSSTMLDMESTTLKEAFFELEDETNLLIDYALTDTAHYHLTIPLESPEHVRSYLLQTCGIALVPEQKNTPIVQVVFHQKEH